MDDKSIVLSIEQQETLGLLLTRIRLHKKLARFQGCLDAKFSTNAKQVLVFVLLGFICGGLRFFFINQTAF